MRTWWIRGGRLVCSDESGEIAEVREAAGGRWSAVVRGVPCTPLGRASALLTWSTAEGARAHVERVLRHDAGGVSAFRGRSRAGETLGTFAPFDDSLEDDDGEKR